MPESPHARVFTRTQPLLLPNSATDFKVSGFPSPLLLIILEVHIFEISKDIITDVFI